MKSRGIKVNHSKIFQLNPHYSKNLLWNKDILLNKIKPVKEIPNMVCNTLRIFGIKTTLDIFYDKKVKEFFNNFCSIKNIIYHVKKLN